MDTDSTRAPGTLFDTIARKHGASVGPIALAWLLQRSPATLPTPGTTSIEPLMENIGAAASGCRTALGQGILRAGLRHGTMRPQLTEGDSTMNMQTPAALVTTLIDARTNRDIDRAVLCYEAGATVATEPGSVVSGLAPVRAFTEAAAALPITFGEPQIVEGEGIALQVSAWTLHDAAGKPSVEGRTADVLRRQSNGEWFIAIDKPWGTGIAH